MKIIDSLLPQDRRNRPGGENSMEYITIHETGNYANGADAAAHAAYLKTTSEKVSWHYSVDEEGVYRHIPDNEVAWHAGTTSGNTRSIGIEVCVNGDGNFNRALDNTAELVRYLMELHNIPIERVVQHNKWNGKNCPANLRLSGWDEFIKKCLKEKDDMTKKEVLEIIREYEKSKAAQGVSDWAKTAWEAAQEKNVTDGTRPQSACTREEVITMLYRAGALEE